MSGGILTITDSLLAQLAKDPTVRATFPCFAGVPDLPDLNCRRCRRRANQRAAVKALWTCLSRMSATQRGELKVLLDVRALRWRQVDARGRTVQITG